jgi:hypothetical protein
MLSFNSLGNYGHIGNQMFQYAALVGIANKNKVSYCIPPTEFFGAYYPLLSKLDDCFDLNCDRKITDSPILSEQTYKFDESLFFNLTEDYDLQGYFQSEKYFEHVKEKIKQEYQFKQSILDPCLEFRQSYGELISLHVRRSDYVNNPTYHLPGESYYQKALNEINSDGQVLVFSDDSEWCKQQEIFSSDRFLISNTMNAYQDLCLMSLCDYHIIANSSFSWWGAWLSNSKQVYAPKNWFTGDLNNDTVDLYCKNWIVI